MTPSSPMRQVVLRDARVVAIVPVRAADRRELEAGLALGDALEQADRDRVRDLSRLGLGRGDGVLRHRAGDAVLGEVVAALLLLDRVGRDRAEEPVLLDLRRLLVRVQRDLERQTSHPCIFSAKA